MSRTRPAFRRCDAAEPENRPTLSAVVDLPRLRVAEDAPPLVAGAPEPRLIGVFDGLGGAGARKVMGEDGSRSSAYYASRAARGAALSVAQSGPPHPRDGARAAAVFASTIGHALAMRHGAAAAGSGRVRSALLRSYPTTAALLLFHPVPGGVTSLAMWAGDSRCYALTPAAGLQQLSSDDSLIPCDAMAALQTDSPMNNMLTGDAPCRLASTAHLFAGPVVLLVATDGAFGCLPSPMHFERLLLGALTSGGDIPQWQNTVSECLAANAVDDISIAVAFIGWRSLAHVAADFAPRLAGLHELLAPFDHAPESRAASLLATAWSAYRADYMARLPEAWSRPWL